MNSPSAPPSSGSSAGDRTGRPQPSATRVDPRNRPGLIAVLLGASVVTIDISMTSTALPAIGAALDVPPTMAIWVVNAYYLAVIAALLPIAALGDIFSHRRIFVAGLVVFCLGSLASSFSDSLAGLVIGRSCVGIGSAAVNATTPALIRTLYPANRLGRGLGLYAMVVGISLSLGPPSTSAVIAVADWHWLYRFAIPVALGAAVLGHFRLPVLPRSAGHFDWVAAVLCSAAFALLLFAISGVARLGWQSVVAAAAGALICGVALHRREAGRPAPLLAVDLLRIPLFALSSVTAICAFTVQGLVFVVLPFLFKIEMGYTQIEAGLLITPWPAALAAMTLIAAPMSDRVAPGILAFAGLLTLAVGLFFIATMPVDASIPGIALRLLVCAVGFGLFQSPNMVALMSSAPVERSGSAGGILAISRLLGQALGAVVVALCLWMWSQGGMHMALWLGSVVAVLGGAFSILRVLPSICAAR